MRNMAAVNVATVVWLGVTVILGALGYYFGGRFSRRLWGEKQQDS